MSSGVFNMCPAMTSCSIRGEVATLNGGLRNDFITEMCLLRARDSLWTWDRFTFHTVCHTMKREMIHIVYRQVPFNYYHSTCDSYVKWACGPRFHGVIDMWLPRNKGCTPLISQKILSRSIRFTLGNNRQ